MKKLLGKITTPLFHQNEAIPKEKRKNSSLTLQTQIFINMILKENKIEIIQLSKDISTCEIDRHRNVLRWINGTNTPSKNNQLEKIFDSYPTSKIFYELPLFTLLKSDITTKDLDSIKKKLTYKTSNKRLCWNFPSYFTNRSNLEEHLISFDDSEKLIQKGDLWGFTGILFLLRQAELRCKEYEHKHLVKATFRAFPALCRHDFFRAYWKELHSLLYSKICQKMNNTFSDFTVDTSIIEEQIFAKNPFTHRSEWLYEKHLRPKDPIRNNEPIPSLDRSVKIIDT